MFKIRAFQLKDFYYFTELLGKKWDLGKDQSKATNNICAWIYAFELFSWSKKFFTLEIDGNAQGFVGYQLYGEKKSFVNRVYQVIAWIATYMPAVKNRQGLIDYKNEYQAITPKELKVRGNADLTLLIVDEKMQGKGYGKELVSFVKNELSQQANTLFIETDDSCNLKFYEKQGCQIERKIPIYKNNAFLENAYLLKVSPSKK